MTAATASRLEENPAASSPHERVTLAVAGADDAAPVVVATVATTTSTLDANHVACITSARTQRPSSSSSATHIVFFVYGDTHAAEHILPGKTNTRSAAEHLQQHTPLLRRLVTMDSTIRTATTIFVLSDTHRAPHADIQLGASLPRSLWQALPRHRRGERLSRRTIS